MAAEGEGDVRDVGEHAVGRPLVVARHRHRDAADDVAVARGVPPVRQDLAEVDGGRRHGGERRGERELPKVRERRHLQQRENDADGDEHPRPHAQPRRPRLPLEREVVVRAHVRDLHDAGEVVAAPLHRRDEELARPAEDGAPELGVRRRARVEAQPPEQVARHPRRRRRVQDPPAAPRPPHLPHRVPELRAAEHDEEAVGDEDAPRRAVLAQRLQVLLVRRRGARLVVRQARGAPALVDRLVERRGWVGARAVVRGVRRGRGDVAEEGRVHRSVCDPSGPAGARTSSDE